MEVYIRWLCARSFEQYVLGRMWEEVEERIVGHDGGLQTTNFSIVPVRDVLVSHSGQGM